LKTIEGHVDMIRSRNFENKDNLLDKMIQITVS